MARPPKVGGARDKHIAMSSEPVEPASPEDAEPTIIEDLAASGAPPDAGDDGGAAAVEPFYQGGPTGIEIDPEAEEKVRASLALLLDSLGHLSEEMLEAARTFLTQGDANADPPSPGGLLVDMQVQLWWLARELGLDVKAELEKRLTAFDRVMDAHRRQADLIRHLQEQLALKEIPPPAAPTPEERCLMILASGVNLRRSAAEPPLWSWGFVSFADGAVNALASKGYAKFRADGASGTYVTITDDGRKACVERFG
jgi:hypothetical protein